MIDVSLLNSLSVALSNYRKAIAQTMDRAAREDYSRLAAIAEKVVAAAQADDMAQARLGVLGFSRQVSDSLSTQPLEFKALAEVIAQVRKAVL